MRLQLALLIALTTCSTVLGRDVEAYSEHVILRQLSTVLSFTQNTPNISISSDFPVTSMLYNDGNFQQDGAPLGEYDLTLVLTSDCSREELGGRPYINYDYGEEPGILGINIRMNSNIDADIDDLSFLETSTFGANWSNTDYRCSLDYEGSSTPEIPVEESGSANGRRKGIFFSAAVIITNMMFAGTSRQHNSHFLWIMATATMILLVVCAREDSNVTPTRKLQDTPLCKINVELLHNGCRTNPLIVRAPAARVAEVVLEDKQEYVEGCTTYYEAGLRFPEATLIEDISSEDPKPLRQISTDRCFQAIEGRGG